MKRKVFILLIVASVLALVCLLLHPRLYIASGYAAKCLASGVFVAERTPKSVIGQDLDYSIVKYTRNRINYEDKSVTSSFFGFAKQTAVYREGFGCALIGDMPIGDVQKASFNVPRGDSNALWRKPWPQGDRVKDTVFGSIDYERLGSAVERAFDSSGESVKRTAAVVVLYKGEIVGERYWEEKGIGEHTRLWGWSMSKGIVNAMVGVLVREGVLSVGEGTPVNEWQGDERESITVDNLLRMSSGLRWDEGYSTVSDVTTMLYRQADMYGAAIRAPACKRPGEEWFYSSGTTNILSGVIRQVLDDDITYYSMPYKEIFSKAGMYSMFFETDAAGNFVGSSYSYATARDWARFGLLYYNDGVWSGDTILPVGWVGYTRSPAKASDGKYGAQFWLNKSLDLPDVPEDMYACQGHRGQRIFVIPSKSMVVVRLGFSESHFDHNVFLRDILAALKE